MKGSKKQPPGSDISVPGVDLGQLERLLSFMSEHGLEEFEYAHGDLRIRLKKAIPQPAAAPVLALPVAQAAAPQAVAAQARRSPAQTAAQAGSAPARSRSGCRPRTSTSSSRPSSAHFTRDRAPTRGRSCAWETSSRRARRFASSKP